MCVFKGPVLCDLWAVGCGLWAVCCVTYRCAGFSPFAERGVLVCGFVYVVFIYVVFISGLAPKKENNTNWHLH